MSKNAPTLFDDFFLDNENPAPEKPKAGKSKSKKGAASAVKSLFIEEENTETPQDSKTETLSEMESSPVLESPQEMDLSHSNILVEEKNMQTSSDDEVQLSNIESEEWMESPQTEHDDTHVIINEDVNPEDNAISEATQKMDTVDIGTQKVKDDYTEVQLIDDVTNNNEELIDEELIIEEEEEEISSHRLDNDTDDEFIIPQNDLSIFLDEQKNDSPTLEENKSIDDKLTLQYFEEIDYFNRPQNITEDEAHAEKEQEATPVEDDLSQFAPEDWQLTKQYYTIGEVADMFKVNISLIRFWSNQFKLKPRTNKKGNRYYTPAQIDTLQLIQYLVKEKKHTIKGAQEKLKTHKKLMQKNMLLKDSLMDLKSKLEELKNNF